MWKSAYSSYEKSEIKLVDKVYYHKKNPVKNFDTSTGRLRMEVKQHLIYRYEILKLIDEGSFGNVVKVLDHKTKKQYAIKVIKSGDCFFNKSKVEVETLSKFKDHDNNRVLLLYGTFKFRNHLCLIMKLYKTNLSKFIKKNRIEEDFILKTEAQIRQGLEYIHNLDIIHCDIKTDNILLKNNNDIVICDFGLVEKCKKGNKVDYSQKQTLWYRAPEILFSQDFDHSIDYWGLGCILYEMKTGRVLFKVSNEIELFVLLNVYLGPPPNLHELKKYHYLYDSIENPNFVKYRDNIYVFKDTEFKRRNKFNYLDWNPDNRI